METETIWEFPCWLCQQILGSQGPRVLTRLQCQWFSTSTSIHICFTIVCDLQDRPLFSDSLFSEKVKDLFPEGSFSSSTKLVLINTVYFKGLWDREFKKEHTREEEFWLNKVWSFIYVVCLLLACTVKSHLAKSLFSSSDFVVVLFSRATWVPYDFLNVFISDYLLQNTSKPVQMMTQCSSFSFTLLEDLQAKIVGIPYKNSDLSMFVLLPNDIDGLEKVNLETSWLISFFKTLYCISCTRGAWEHVFWTKFDAWLCHFGSISHFVHWLPADLYWERDLLRITRMQLCWDELNEYFKLYGGGSKESQPFWAVISLYEVFAWKKPYMHEYKAFAWNSIKPLDFAFLLLILFLDVGLSTFFSKQWQC